MAGSSSAWSLGFLLVFVTGFILHRDVAAEHFAVFGHLDIQPRNYGKGVCRLYVSVQIGDHVWRRQLDSSFYVFRAPLHKFLGFPGLIDLHVSKGLQDFSLWRRIFVVDDTGGYQADAVLTLPVALDCLSEAEEHTNHRETGKLISVISYGFRELEVCSLNDQTCPNVMNNTIDGASEVDDLLETDATDSASVLERKEQPCCMVFGSRRLRPWHLVCLAISAVFIHLQILLLRGFLSSQLGYSPSSLFNNEHPAAAWELWTFSAFGKKNSRHRNVVASGMGCFNKAWSDAQELLSSCECDRGACFCYNGGSLSKHRKQSGNLWNRDAFGRLIRS